MSIVEALLCLLDEFVSYVLVAIADFANYAIAGLATTLIAILPYLPTLPGWPTGGDWSWLNWIVPMSTIVSLAGTIVSLFVSFFALRIAFRWIKAL